MNKKLERNPVGSDEHRSATGGLTAAGRAHFARTEGAHLKPGVKEKNPSGEQARRKGSFLTRFFTNPRGPMKDEKGRPTRLALSAQAWGEPVPDNDADAHRLAAKGRSLLGKSKEASWGAFFEEVGAELDKEADVKTKLLPHQQRVVDRIQQEDQPGLVVVHGLGSGKTLTSIAAQDALGMPAQVVAPASLLGNYRKERTKHLEGKSPKASLLSMQNLAVKGQKPDAPLMIVDEAHRARDPSSATFQMLKGNTSQKRLLLSGSPFYNHPADVAGLIDIAADAKVLPYDRDEFTRRYISEKVINPSLLQRGANLFRSEENKVKPGTVPVLYEKNAPELREAFHKWIDFHPGSTENFPTVERKTVEVPMSNEQLRVYDTLMDKAPAWVAQKVKRGLPPSKQESQQLNAFLTAARQASNSTAPFVPEGKYEDPKIQAAFGSLQKAIAEDPETRAVIYSNYLDAGINPYKKRLDEAKIPYGEFTGAMPMKKREQLVRDYNEGKLRALLLSSAGGEGLDLKGTRLMQILEPHWNDEKLKQVEGRGIRYMSHADLPEEKRKVLVENYLATRPEGLMLSAYNKVTGRKPDQSVDQYLTQMSKSKSDLINQFRALLPNQEKTAAKWKETEETKKLRNSFSARAANEVAWVLPVAGDLGMFGHALAGNEGALIGGAAGALLGHWGAKNIGAPLLLTDAKKMAREAAKKPSKENFLRENANRVLVGEVAGKAFGNSIPSMVNLAPAMVSNQVTPELLQRVGGQVLGAAAGAIASGYLDKYKRQIAINEIDNARKYESERDAEKLKRMRRQIGELETKVEGDGWKMRGEDLPKVNADVKVNKDRSGKAW